MDVYAYVELLHVLLKLGIVYLLVVGNFDKLILYASLMLIVNIIIALIYRVYCIRHYEETHFQPKPNKIIAKNILSFSLYNLLGNLGVVVNTQGTAFVINIFFGVIYNAAASIAVTISNVVTGFASNVMTAFRPQITKCYAQDNISQFQSLLLWSIKSILLIYSLIAIPVGFGITELLSIWLVEVPSYADIFGRLLLISIFFETIRFIIIMGIHATGKVRLVSVSTGVLFCVNPLCIFVLFEYGLSPAFAYISTIAINVILSIINILILKHNERRISIRKFIVALLRVISCIALAILALVIAIQFAIENPLFRLIYIVLISTIVITALGYYVVLNASQRSYVISLVKNKLHKK